MEREFEHINYLERERLARLESRAAKLDRALSGVSPGQRAGGHKAPEHGTAQGGRVQRGAGGDGGYLSIAEAGIAETGTAQSRTAQSRTAQTSPAQIDTAQTGTAQTGIRDGRTRYADSGYGGPGQRFAGYRHGEAGEPTFGRVDPSDSDARRRGGRAGHRRSETGNRAPRGRQIAVEPEVLWPERSSTGVHVRRGSGDREPDGRHRRPGDGHRGPDLGQGDADQLGTGQRGTGQPGTGQPGTGQGGTGQRGTRQGSTRQGGTGQGGTRRGSTRQGGAGYRGVVTGHDGSLGGDYGADIARTRADGVYRDAQPGYGRPDEAYRQTDAGSRETRADYTETEAGFSDWPDGYDDPDDGYLEADGYRGPDDGYSGADDGYRGPDDGYPGADEGYLGADSGFHVAGRGYRDAAGYHPAGPAGYGAGFAGGDGHGYAAGVGAGGPDERTEVLINRGRRDARPTGLRRWTRHWRVIAVGAAGAMAGAIAVTLIVSGSGASWPASVAVVQREITTACQNPNVVSEPTQVDFACAKDTSQILWVFSLLTSDDNPNFSDRANGRQGLEPITPAQGGDVAWSLNLHHPYNPANPTDSLEVAARAINDIIGGATVTGSNGAPVVQPGLESTAANCARYTGSSAIVTHQGFPAVCAQPVTSPAGEAALVSDVFKQWMLGTPSQVADEAGVLFENAGNPGNPQVQAILNSLPQSRL